MVSLTLSQDFTKLQLGETEVPAFTIIYGQLDQGEQIEKSKEQRPGNAGLASQGAV